MPAEPAELAERVIAGDRNAIATALNLVEDRRAISRSTISTLLNALAANGPDASHRIGLTGPPGVGKSTLAAALTRGYRGRGLRVGVVAVDPSSMRSGGSLLGDRARMNFAAADEGAFVRSLATEGDPGGLAWAANAAARVLSSAFDIVIVETTGVGQTETDIVHVADTVVLVVQPGSGDTLQFLKAGIMEIPDILVVNKSDLGEHAKRTFADLKAALFTLRMVGMESEIATLAASALSETGIDALIDAITAHRNDGLNRREMRRRAGDCAWARSIFVRRHGEHGVETVSDLDDRILALITGGVAAPRAAEQLSATYLAATVFRD